MDDKNKKDREELEAELRDAKERIRSLEQELEETQQGLNALSLELEERVEKRTKELEKVREDFRGLVKNASEGIFRISPDGTQFIFANPALAEMFGFDEVERLIGGVSSIPKELVSNPDRYWKLLDRASSGNLIEGIELSVSRKDDSKIWFRISLRSVCEGDNLVYYEGMVQDITEERRHRNRLLALHENLDLLQDAENEEEAYEAAIVSAHEVLQFDNAIIYELDGGTFTPVATTEAIESRTVGALEPNDSVAGRTLRGGETLSGNLGDFELMENRFQEYSTLISAAVGNRGVLQIFSGQRDSFGKADVRLTELLARHLNQELERIDLETRLNELARRDTLTGLYNRYYFDEALNKEIERSKRYDHPLAFLMVDINGFKDINDNHGHQVGDRILAKTADILDKNIREADTVVRYGGDEFLIMMPETGNGANLVGDRFEKNLRDWSDNCEVLEEPLTLAVGKSYWYPDGEKEIEEVIALADERMYRDKRSKKDGIAQVGRDDDD